MEWKNRNIIKFAGALTFAILAGCATVPKNPGNPYLGYMYIRSIQGDTGFKQDGIESQLKAYREQIASAEFQIRKEQFPRIYNEKSLDKMSDYVALLTEPITIEKNQWEGASTKSLSKKENKALNAYWDANHPFSIDGAENFNEWGNELENAKRQLEVDTRKAEELEAKIDGLRVENLFRDALVISEELRPYKPKETTELVKLLKAEAADYWIGKRLAEIDELRRVEVYDHAHEQAILAVFAGICDDVSAFGHREDFDGVFTHWQDLLGDNWRKRIEEMGDSKEYWAAYEFARKRYDESRNTTKYAKSLRAGLKVKISKGYLTILDNAIRHYSGLASSAYKTKRLDGKAYVYCCMAKEMYDFMTLADLGYHEDTESWYERIAQQEKMELLPTLKSRVSRRLVIQKFDRDMLELSKKFRKSSLEKYDYGNDHAWALEVVTDDVSLAQIKADTSLVQPDDYVVKWSNAEIEVKVTQDPPSQRTAFVKTKNFNLIDNPERKNKSSELYKLKQVRAQKVALYSLIDTRLGLDLSCNMQVSCLHRAEEKPLKLPVTEEKVAEYNKAYGSGTNTTSLLLLSNVSEEMKYYPPDIPEESIPLDPIPENKKFSLPEEEKIQAGLIHNVITDLSNELESLINMYPVEMLSGADYNAPDEFLNTLGTVLFYIENLSSADAAKRSLAANGYEWLHLRDQIDENMKTWCVPGGRWESVGNEERMILRFLWEECVRLGNDQDDR